MMNVLAEKKKKNKKKIKNLIKKFF